MHDGMGGFDLDEAGTQVCEKCEAVNRWCGSADVITNMIVFAPIKQCKTAVN
jgi:hypothetical protein